MWNDNKGDSDSDVTLQHLKLRDDWVTAFVDC